MNILSFRGRSNRLQFLFLSIGLTAVMAVLFVILMSLGALAHGVVTHSGDASFAQYMRDVRSGHSASYSTQSVQVSTQPAGLIVLVFFVLGLLLTWLGFAVQVRRFHDMGQSGWFVLLNLIPGAGFVIWLVLVLASGQSGPNAYGQAPT